MARRIGAGFNRLWYGVIDEDGIFIGATTTAPAAGAVAGSGMARLEGARTLPIAVPEPNVETAMGDDEAKGTFTWSAEDTLNGTFEMAIGNDTFDALVQGTKVQSLGTMDISLLDPVARAEQSICLLLSRRALKKDAGLSGVKAWENYFIPRATIVPLGVSVEQRTFTPYQYNFTADKSERSGWSTISQSLHGSTGASAMKLASDNPLFLQRFTGDGATLTYTLDYPPFSAATARVFVDDLQQAVTTDYTVSGVSLVFQGGSMPALDSVIDVLLEVAEADLS